jgi:group I intron endonuclease
MAEPKPNSIYAIRCKSTGKVYIGRSQNPHERIRQHFSQLKNGRCECGTPAFQEDFKIYGFTDFETYILEKDVSPGRFRDREAYWIGEYKSTDGRYGYNKDTMKLDPSPVMVTGLPPKPFEKN